MRISVEIVQGSSVPTQEEIENKVRTGELVEGTYLKIDIPVTGFCAIDKVVVYTIN